MRFPELALTGLILLAGTPAALAQSTDFTVTLTGAVSALNPAPNSGVYAGVQVGDATTLELVLTYPGNSPITPAAAASASYAFAPSASTVTVGAASDTFDPGQPHSFGIYDSYLGIRDRAAIFNRPLAGGGLARFELIDSTDTAFDEADVRLLRGVYPPATWTTTSFGLQVGGGFIEIAVQDFTIGTTGPGEVICAPAVANSTGHAALIAATGADVLATNGLGLDARRLPANTFGFFLVSDTQAFVVGPGGSQGNLCLGGAVGRYQVQVQNSGPNGEFQLPVDLTALPQPTGPVAAQVGETWTFQAWYRDANPMATSNFTDAIAVTLQ